VRTPRPAAAPRFPVLRGRISADGTATLDGRTVATDTRDPERALLAAAAATAGLYGHLVRLHLTETAGRPRRLVVSPDGPAYPESTRPRRRRPRRDHPDPGLPPGGGDPDPPRPRGVDRDPADLHRLSHPDPPDRRRRLADRDPGADRMSTHPDTTTPVRTPRTPPPTTTATPATDPVQPSADEDPRPVAPATPPPAARPERGLDVNHLLPARLSPAGRMASWGWRGRVAAATGGRLRIRPGLAELRHRDRLEAVRRPLVGARTVVVVNPKGGAGKTPAALLLAATLGAHRGSALAWDNNETRGTLGLRALAHPDANRTVWDLLADVDHFQTVKARIGDLAAYTRPQGEARFDVLASDGDPARMAQVDAAGFRRIREVLARFYGVIVIDTGNNVRASNWQAAVDAADALVVVSTYQADTAETAGWVLDHLRSTGRARLADQAVTVLTAARPAVDPAVRRELVTHYARTTRAVVEIPYDPVIAIGQELDLYALHRRTREAWLAATAAVADGLSTPPQGARDA